MSNHYPTLLEFFRVGKALKSHGTNGQLRLLVDDHHKLYIRPEAFIFFEFNGSKVPFRILTVDNHAHFVISLRDVANKKESDSLAGRDIFIPIEEVKPKHRFSPAQLETKWTGYRIIDSNSSRHFEIIRTEQYPQQLMAIVLVDQKELLVPLTEKLISEINRKEKVIYMEIPEGLLEL